MFIFKFLVFKLKKIKFLKSREAYRNFDKHFLCLLFVKTQKMFVEIFFIKNFSRVIE